jgi:hypothetical protein
LFRGRLSRNVGRRRAGGKGDSNKFADLSEESFEKRYSNDCTWLLEAVAE